MPGRRSGAGHRAHANGDGGKPNRRSGSHFTPHMAAEIPQALGHYESSAYLICKGETMRSISTFAAVFVIAAFSASIAEAACSGTNGRGWGKGQGNGKFQMTTADKTCNIDFPGFIDDRKKTRTPATNVTITRAPKSGKINVTGKGLVYTPAAGFKGNDRFCTKNTAAGVRGTLRGCITVTVR